MPDLPDLPKPSPADARFSHRALVAAVIFVAVASLAVLLWYSVYVLFLLFGGVLVAILLRALAEVVSRWTKLSHRWSLAVVLVVAAGALGTFWYVAASSLTEQFIALSQTLPEAWASFQQRMRGTSLGRLLLDQAGLASTSQPATQPAVGGNGAGGTPDGALRLGATALLGRFGGLLSSMVDLLAAVVVVLFTGLFLAFDPALYVRGLIRLVPPAGRSRAGEVLGAVGYTLKWWLIGQGVTMLFVVIATWLGLLALGVPLAFVLGVIAGLFNFIPNFGPLFSMVPATLLAMTISPGTALGTIVLFLVLQNLEGNVLTPLIQRKAVDLPPALGIIAQILLGILVGPLGLLLAWPLCAAVVLLVKMLYVEDVLGDELPTPDDQPQREVREAGREVRKMEADEKRP